MSVFYYYNKILKPGYYIYITEVYLAISPIAQRMRLLSSGKGPWLHHNMVDGVMAGTCTRGRDHMAEQEARKIQGPGSLF